MRRAEAVAALQYFWGVPVAAKSVQRARCEKDTRRAGADGRGADDCVDDGRDDLDPGADKGDDEGRLRGVAGRYGERRVVKAADKKPMLAGIVVRWGRRDYSHNQADDKNTQHVEDEDAQECLLGRRWDDLARVACL